MSKVKCHKCGQYHDSHTIEVVFKYPDAYFDIPEEERSERVKKNDDICIIDEREYYIRGLLPIKTTLIKKKEYHWGVWVKVDADTYKIIYDNWDLENQDHITGLTGHLANDIKFYKRTLNKEVSILLTGNKTRPKFHFINDKRLISLQSEKIGNKDLIEMYHFHFVD
jgi:hypothetical protein